MPEIDLSILMKVVDNASAEFKRINAEAIKEIEKLKGVNVTASNESKKSVDKLSEATNHYTQMAETMGESVNFVKGELDVFNQEIASGVKLTEEQQKRYDALKNKLNELTETTKKAGNQTEDFGRHLRGIGRDISQIQ